MKPAGWRYKKSKRSNYKQERLYSSRAWRSFRQSYLTQQGGICDHCGQIPRLMRDLHLDHITRIADGGAIYDQDNLQVLCRRCHGAKTYQETLAGGRSK